MSKRPGVALEPRKAPVQARSTESVEAILKATLQVLVRVGKEKLTTTLVAARAGVSVGTLYQYFPNKSALLQAALLRHLEGVTKAVQKVCEEQRGASLQGMTAAVVTAFLEAKMRSGATSVALYAVSSDVDGARIGRQMGQRSKDAIAAMLLTAREPLAVEASAMAETLQGAMQGVSRRLLETWPRREDPQTIGPELVRMACAYVEACRAPLRPVERRTTAAFAAPESERPWK